MKGSYKPNEIPFGSKSKGKLPPGSYPIQFEGKRKYSFLSVPNFSRESVPVLRVGSYPLGLEFRDWIGKLSNDVCKL